MRKAIYILYFIISILGSLTLIQFFTEYESSQFSEENILNIDMDKLYTLSKTERINTLHEIAAEEGVNIYQFQYDIDKTGNEINTYYYALGDEALYSKKFDTKSGLTKSFNPRIKIYSYPLEDISSVKTKFWVYVESNENHKMISAIERLTAKDANTNTPYVINFITGIYKNIIFSGITPKLMLILIMFIPVTIYFYFYKLKEIQVKKLFGYSMFDIKIGLVSDLLKIQLTSFAAAFFVQLFYLYIYNKFGRITQYLSLYFSVMAIFIFLTASINYFCFNIVKMEKPVNALKNKRPLNLMLLFNFVFKLSFAVFIIFLFIIGFNEKERINNVYKNMDKWILLKEYQEFNYNYFEQFPTADQGYNDRLASIRSQNIFRKAERYKGILVDTSRYSNRTKENILFENDRRTLFVNKNYLHLEGVLDEVGNKLDIENLAEDIVYILIPQKFESKTEFIMGVWSKFLYSMNRIEKNKIKPIYIKNGQKFFLYAPELEIENNNFAPDPILVVVNADTYGNLLSMSAMSNYRFKAYIGQDDYDIEELKSDIIENEAADMIDPHNSFDASIAPYLLKLQYRQYEIIFLFFCLGVFEILILYVFIKNYIERHKQLIAVQKLHGFSFLTIYSSCFIQIYATIFVLLFIISFLSMKIFPVIFIGYCVFENFFSILFLIYWDRKYIGDYLKGR